MKESTPISIDLTMSGIGRQFAKLSAEIENLLMNNQAAGQRIEELEEELKSKVAKKK